MALASIGAEAIRDFDERSKSSRMCEAFYEKTRQYLLVQFSWPFARRQLKLNMLADFADYLVDGTYPYALPTDCLLPIDILPEGHSHPWDILGKALCCRYDSTQDVVLSYVADITDETQFSSAFTNILALGIAVRLAPVMSSDKPLVTALLRQYETEKLTAFEIDANIGNRYLSNDNNARTDTFVSPDETMQELE